MYLIPVGPLIRPRHFYPNLRSPGRCVRWGSSLMEPPKGDTLAPPRAPQFATFQLAPGWLWGADDCPPLRHPAPQQGIVMHRNWPTRMIAAPISIALLCLLFGCAGSPRFPVSPQNVVSGREQCAAALNGAADCSAAGNALCRAKGFQAGSSVDTQTEYCFDRSRAGVGNCTFVTRAACH
jgi:hypothetical protein